jgi:hypothetical protein
MDNSYNLLNLSNNFTNSKSYFKINSNVVEHMDENGGNFEPPDCNNNNDCASYSNSFGVTSDQLVCGNAWRYGNQDKSKCLLKCDNDIYCNQKGLDLDWPEGMTCKRNFCIFPGVDDPCLDLKAEEFTPSNGTFRINGDFVEREISKDEQVFVDGIFCNIKTEEQRKKEEEERIKKEEEQRQKEKEEERKRLEEERRIFEEEQKKMEEEEKKREEEEKKKKEEEERKRQEQLELIRLENERLIKEEEERQRQEQLKLEEEKRLREEEEERLRLEQEAKRKEEEEERKRKEEEARKKAEEERKRKEEEERKRKEEEERKRKEEEERLKREEEERKRKEEEERKRKEEEERKRKEEEKRKRKEEEERIKKEEEERKRLEEIRKKKEAEERAKLLEASKKQKATNKVIVKDAATIALEKCIKDGFINCEHKDILNLINFYNENQINDIIVEKCKISAAQKNYIFDKIFINDEEELDGIALSKKKYNLMKTKFDDSKISCIVNTLKNEIETERKLKAEREKLLAKRRATNIARPPSPVQSPAQPVDSGSGFNDLITLLFILVVVYLILKLKKLI